MQGPSTGSVNNYVNNTYIPQSIVNIKYNNTKKKDVWDSTYCPHNQMDINGDNPTTFQAVREWKDSF